MPEATHAAQAQLDAAADGSSPESGIEVRLAGLEEAVAVESRRTKELIERFNKLLARVETARRGTGPPLAFVHIPKTAGTTVKSMLVGAYSRLALNDAGNYLRSQETAIAKLGKDRASRRRVTVGHVPYSVLREHLPADTRYITFLREPVDRVLSHYYRHRAKKPERRGGGELVTARGKITAGSIEEALALPQLSNLATRFLCAHPSPMGELPESALDDAKANLSELAFVGIQERFEESLVLLRRTLGLDPVPYEDQKVSSDRPAVEEIPDEQRALIEERNRLDAELYAFGLGLLEVAVAGADRGFAAEVEALRASRTAGSGPSTA